VTQGAVLLSTDLVEPELRADYWRDVTRPLFDTTPDSNSPLLLEGSFATRLIGPMMVGRARFNAQNYVRDRSIVSQSGLEDFYLVQLFTSGMAVADCEGVAMTVCPGDVYAFDMDRTFQASVSAGSTLSVLLHRERLDRLSGRSLHGTQFKAGQPLTRLLADFIVGLNDVAPDIRETEAPTLEDAAVALFASALNQNPADTALQDPALAPVLRRRLLDVIDAKLTDPELGPAMLLRQFRVSRGHLYRMFEADGGVARVIRERRLDAAYRMLMRPSSPPMTQLAHDLGFSGAGQFQRAFRTRFGMSPSEARQERRTLIVEGSRLAGMQAYLAGFSAPAPEAHFRPSRTALPNTPDRRDSRNP